uniref:Immunoglobulin domain-containing protein n=1 Tax=Anabas testudineus TaxID=64144 RepID=A0A3Q1JED2_ANATE
MKYICRGNQPSSCLQQALITSNNTQNTQFSLTDDKKSRKFTVTITSLTQKDSGSYLCGVKRNTGLDVFSAVDLEVREWCCVKSNKLSGTVGRPLTMQCPYPPQHGTNRKFLCKGDHHRNCTDMVTSQNSSGHTDVRFTLLDDVSSSSFSVTITELKAGDAGTYWCGSDSQWTFGNYTKIQLSLDVVVFNPVVFIVPAALMFILIFVLVVICKYKCHKVRGTAARENRTTTRAADEEEADIYENDDVVVYSKKRTSNQQSTCNQYNKTVQQNEMYGNFNTAEDIYCNEVYSRVCKR